MNSPLAKMAMKYLPQLATSQYQDNPLEEFLKQQAISKGGEWFAGRGTPTAVPDSSKNQYVNVGTRKSSFDQGLAGIAQDSNLEYGKQIKGLNELNQLTKDKTGWGLTEIFTDLWNDEGLTGKGKFMAGLASTLGPGLATYLALLGEGREAPVDAKDYRSAVDDYYAAKARGEDPNPADFGLAPTPAEDMIKGLRYDKDSDKYIDLEAQRAIRGNVSTQAGGGIAGLFGGGDVKRVNETLIEGDPRKGLLEVFNLREEANAPRRVGLASTDMMEMSDEVLKSKTGGVVGLALGGDLEKRGMVRGPGGPKDDKIPAMLSNGEFVMTAKAVDNAGGPKAMYGLMNKLDPESSRPPRSVT
jgi:hypothetical protein